MQQELIFVRSGDRLMEARYVLVSDYRPAVLLKDIKAGFWTSVSQTQAHPDPQTQSQIVNKTTQQNNHLQAS